MVRLAVRTRQTGGLTLVEGRLHNDDPRPVRVTVATDADPVYPPRSGGRPVEGWEPAAGRARLVVGAGQRVGVGFATPATPEPPLRVADREPDPAVQSGLPATPAGVASALDDPRPPAAVADPVSTGRRERRTGDRRRGVAAELRRLRRAAARVASATAGVERRLRGGRR